MIFTLRQPPGSTLCGLPALLSPCQVPEPGTCRFTGLLPLVFTALAFSLSLPVPLLTTGGRPLFFPEFSMQHLKLFGKQESTPLP